MVNGRVFSVGIGSKCQVSLRRVLLQDLCEFSVEVPRSSELARNSAFFPFIAAVLIPPA